MDRYLLERRQIALHTDRYNDIDGQIRQIDAQMHRQTEREREREGEREIDIDRNIPQKTDSRQFKEVKRHS